MKIQNVRRGAGHIIAWFDLEVGEAEIRVLNCYVKRNLAGDLRVYAPSPSDHRIVTFSREYSDKIINAAMAAVEGRVADGLNNAA